MTRGRTGPLDVGDVLLEKYEIRALIGRGGHACVYHAVQTFTGRHVAIKCLHRPNGLNLQALRRGKAEAQILSHVCHLRLVHVLDAGITERGMLYIVMELLEGPNLREVERAFGPLSVPEVLDVGAQVASGLHAAHLAGAIHRDMKPENVVITAGNNVKVLDFGVAKLADAAAWTTERDLAHGTVHYMSPEQLRLSALTPRSDIYTLGVVMYEALLGKHPVVMHLASEHANVWEISRAILMKKPPLLNELCPHVSADVARLINRAIAKVPEQRFGSMLEFEQAILECRAAWTKRAREDGTYTRPRDLGLAPASWRARDHADAGPHAGTAQDTDVMVRPMFLGALSSSDWPHASSRAVTRPSSPAQAQELVARDTAAPTAGDVRLPRSPALSRGASLSSVLIGMSVP